MLSVSDDGVGIPAEDVDRIFQPFHGGFAKGAGLGLAIVHRIVSDQGGSIAVHSQAGRGTTDRRHSACRAAGGGRRLAAAQGTPWDSRSISTHDTDPPPTPARASERAARILVVDDERSMRELLAIVLGREGYEVVVAESGRQALDELERRPVDLLISDIHMPDMTGLDVLRTAKGMNPDLRRHHGHGVRLDRDGDRGAAHGRLRLHPQAVQRRRAEDRRRSARSSGAGCGARTCCSSAPSASAHQFSNIIGRSESMLAVFELIETIAQTTSTVLVTGESGTGKELAARAIHFNSPRKDRPFVAVNCGALTETLLESELFGHVRGAFTGAATNKKGLIEVAERGTIFLDEIGEMSPLMQVKLLRVLQERVFRRVGGTDEICGRRPHHRRDQPRPGADGRRRASSARTSTTGST